MKFSPARGALLAVAIACLVASSARARADVPNVPSVPSDPESPAALNARIPSSTEGPGESPRLVTIGESNAAAPTPSLRDTSEAPTTHLRIELGPSMVKLGGGRLSQPTTMFLAAGWERRIWDGWLQVDAGVRLRSIRLTYLRVQDGLESHSFVSTIVGVVRAHGRLSHVLEIGAWWGAGLGIWSGLGDQNPFSDGGVAPSSPVTLPTLETGLDLSYRRQGSRFELVASLGASGSSVTGKQLWSSTPWIASLNIGGGLVWLF